jgi:tRNA pseudouridine38-40 synthase
VLEYDGTGLSGWQRQENAPTVQEHFEAALSELFGEPTKVTGASRTDAGVHARAQVASMTTTSAIPVLGIRKALNSSLPSAIAVRDVCETSTDFNARFSAAGKHYQYRVIARDVRSP